MPEASLLDGPQRVQRVPSRSQPELEEVGAMKTQHVGMSDEHEQHELDGVASVIVRRKQEGEQ